MSFIGQTEEQIDMYKNYCKNVVNMESLEQLGHGGMLIGDGGGFVPFTHSEFINKIKTDDEFAKLWNVTNEQEKK